MNLLISSELAARSLFGSIRAGWDIMPHAAGYRAASDTAGYIAGWDIVPHRIPCRIGYRGAPCQIDSFAGWDIMPHRKPGRVAWDAMSRTCFVALQPYPPHRSVSRRTVLIMPLPVICHLAHQIRLRDAVDMQSATCTVRHGTCTWHSDHATCTATTRTMQHSPRKQCNAHHPPCNTRHTRCNTQRRTPSAQPPFGASDPPSGLRRWSENEATGCYKHTREQPPGLSGAERIHEVPRGSVQAGGDELCGFRRVVSATCGER
jgi:hypothetical protein